MSYVCFILLYTDTPAVLSPLKQDHILPPVKYYNSDIESLAAEVLASYEDSDVTDDPFVSPFNASSDMWRGLPPICLVVSLKMCHAIFNVLH